MNNYGYFLFRSKYNYFGRNMLISAETAIFWQKQVYFGRNKTISAEYSVSAEFRFFEMASFGFRCFGKKSVSVEHYYRVLRGLPISRIMLTTHLYTDVCEQISRKEFACSFDSRKGTSADPSRTA